MVLGHISLEIHPDQFFSFPWILDPEHENGGRSHDTSPLRPVPASIPPFKSSSLARLSPKIPQFGGTGNDTEEEEIGPENTPKCVASNDGKPFDKRNRSDLSRKSGEDEPDPWKFVPSTYPV